MNKTLVLACLAGVALAACGGKGENEQKSAAPGSQIGIQAATPVAPTLSQADASMPMAQYQKISAERLVYLYHALSGLPIDYEKIADQVSVEYRTTTDSFKKKDILEVLKPRIDAAIADAKTTGRYIFLDFPRASVSLGHYAGATKSFPIQGLPVDEGQYLSLQQSPYRMVFTNGSVFKTLPIADEAKAREIESTISSGIKDGIITYTNVYPTNARLYLYAQASESNNFAVDFQMIKLTMTTLDGQPFAER